MSLAFSQKIGPYFLFCALATDEKSNVGPPQESERSEEQNEDESNHPKDNEPETARSEESNVNEDGKATRTVTRATSAMPLLAHTCSTMPYMSTDEYQVIGLKWNGIR